ncbi:MAG: NAD(P)-dependent oxidoreductase [Nitrospirota bacterium]
MTVLITGASGFIGRFFTRYYLGHGRKVIGVSRKPCVWEHPALGWLQVDLTAPEGERSLRSALDESSFCCLLAAVKPDTVREKSSVPHQNQTIDGVSSAAFADSKCPNGLYLGGLSIFPDDKGLSVDEDSIPAPTSPYTKSKLYGERMFKAAANSSRKNWKILRINAPYGPGMTERAVVHRFLVEAAKGQPLTVFDQGQREQHFTWVGDCAEASAKLESLEPGVYHFVGPDRVTMLDLARKCIAIARSTSPILFKSGDPGGSCPDFGPDRLEPVWPRASRTGISKGLSLFFESFASGK